jgi:hypothetical protein
MQLKASLFESALESDKRGQNAFPHFVGTAMRPFFLFGRTRLVQFKQDFSRISTPFPQYHPHPDYLSSSGPFFTHLHNAIVKPGYRESSFSA